VENKVWYLKQNRLFADASDSGIENCAHLFTMRVVPKKTMIFDLGDAGRMVYLVKTGAVKIARLTPEGREVTVAILGAGDIFGEEILFDGASRTTVAVTMEDALVCTARAEDLFGLLARSPQLALNVAKILSTRLGDASATMEDLAYAKIPDRLMHLFRRLAAEHGSTSEHGVTIDVRLTHADIASLIGSTRETVSLELSHLVRAGRIRLAGKAFVLPQAELIA